jgi:preprotein translocase subunit SecA
LFVNHLSLIIGHVVVFEQVFTNFKVAGLEERLRKDFAIDLPIQKWLDEDESLHEETLREKIIEALEKDYQAKEEQVGAEVLRHFEKSVMLQNLDMHWKEHLAAMDHLRQGIHLRSYAQKNPKQEYKREAFELFAEMLENIKFDVISILSRVQIQAAEDVEAVEEQRRREAQARGVKYQHEQQSAMPQDEQAQHTPYRREGVKVGRNEPCPCGSGKKFKQCHGKIQ